MKYTNSILLFVKIATVIYFVIVLVNLILPVLSGSVLNFNLFTVVMLIIWTVAELSSRGYIKKVVSTVDDKIAHKQYNLKLAHHKCKQCQVTDTHLVLQSNY